MRRPINWITVCLALVFLFMGLSLSGCGGGGTGTAGGQDPPAVSGMLRKVRNAAELETSLKSSLQLMIANGVPASPTATPSVDVSSFSNTNTVEAGVDEFDRARYDGAYLYIAPLPYATPTELRIVRADSATGVGTQVSAIPFPADEFVQGMYVANGRMFVLSSEQFFMTFGALWSSTVAWAPQHMTIRVYDVSVPAQPREVMSATFDGVYVASRRIDDRVYLVSRHTPSAVIDPVKRLTIASAGLDELLPRVRVDGRERSAVAPTNCYVTNEATRAGYPVITTIMMFSLQNPRDFASSCYNEPANGVYASRNALYVSQPRSETGRANFTRIHKFAFADTGPAYVGSVEVGGDVWMNGLNDFRMNEHDGNLRVFTSEWTSDPADATEHYLYIVRPKAAEPALEIIGRLPNALRPAEIGKPNEQLYGVRFIGDRAYGVTFQRVDPLYVFDLSNPADPRIAGELTMPGLSDYLHPVGGGLLLGLGANGGHVKLELFDVSVLENPQSRGAVTLGGTFSYSEATYDHHAFTYLGGSPDRLAFPATITTSGDESQSHSSLHQFEVVGKDLPTTAVLRSAGLVTPPNLDATNRYASYGRSFINGDTVWYVRDTRVWSTSWLAPGQVRGPF